MDYSAIFAMLVKLGICSVSPTFTSPNSVPVRVITCVMYMDNKPEAVPENPPDQEFVPDENKQHKG